MDPDQLVQELGTPRCSDAMSALLGAVNASDLREVEIDEKTFAALVDGTRDRNPRVRWWSIQLLDHIPDERAVPVFIRALSDPVPRVRRNAVHALSCRSCKPGWDGHLPAEASMELQSMAARDPNAKVRAEAARALSCDR